MRTPPRPTLLALCLSSLWVPHALAQQAALATPMAPATAAAAPQAGASRPAAATDAKAQTDSRALTRDASPQKLDTVVTLGQAAALRSAVDKQAAATGIINVVHADGIGQLPDNNAAEALARLPGVSVERDQGEGRFIRVRGLGPDYNTVTINGAVAPASQSDKRAPGLDLVPSGLIRSLEVDKTLTPDQDANSLGGTVTVRTLSAFDQPGRLFTVEAGGNYDANAGKTRPRGSVAFADRFAGGTVGLAVAVSADQRRFASDNVETGGDWNDGKLNSFELRRYEITRERVGAALNLDYRPDAAHLFYLRSFSSRFTDQENRQSMAVEFDEALAPGETGDGTVSRGLKQRKEVNKSSAVVLGTELTQGAWKAWAEVGAGRASENKPDTLSSSSFTADFSGLGYTSTVRPMPTAVEGLNDASNYRFNKAKIEQSHATDQVRHAKVDLQREFDVAGWDLDLKGGLKATRRDKDNAQEVFAPSAKALGKSPYSLTAAQLNLGNFLSGANVSYPWASFGPGIDASKLRTLYGNSLEAFRDDVDSEVNDYAMKERTDAGYVQATFEQGGTQWIAGVRGERVRFEANGVSSVDETLSPTHTTNSTHRWLPALLLRQQLGAETVLRAAVTHSMVRPSFDQLSPGLTVDGDEATLGNPLLKPLRSRNLDLGVERRLGRDGAVSAYVFHKQIRNFAFQTDIAGTAGWEDFSHVETFANGGNATVRGLELSWSQALSTLPAPWNGLVVGANGSFVRSRATIGAYDDGVYASRRIALPSQSDRSINLSLVWESPAFAARLALNHKSPYLLEVGDVLDATQDRRVDTQNQLDASMRIRLAKGLDLNLEALNLGNERYYVYQGDKAHNVQYERYGRAYKVSLKLAMF
ncbi:TonB-dependent receptor [Roseateles sp. YR242]|uniref:TonB-dependent receptor n=1 Tax=Roseateles sp. YR242 TaxID=1855305 RepID=UPI0008B52F85|nr:TonB-dependent receptor [Roseateles sp. YR242]SEK79747.1 TonB-dependent receptor [Roseateles sp. YR242]